MVSTKQRVERLLGKADVTEASEASEAVDKRVLFSLDLRAENSLKADDNHDGSLLTPGHPLPKQCQRYLPVGQSSVVASPVRFEQ